MSIRTPEELRDPDHTPPLPKAVPLGIRHVPAMLVANGGPTIVAAGAAGFGSDGPELLHPIQMSMLFAGLATLPQTIGVGPVGAGLPIVQGPLRLPAHHDPARRRKGSGRARRPLRRRHRGGCSTR